MSAKPTRIILSWLPLAVVVTLLSLMVYGVAQQNLRQSANDPQIQLAEDAVVQLDQGADPAAVVGKPVDAAESLDTGLIVYDSRGKQLASSLKVNGLEQVVPAGVLDYAKAHGRDIVTWQPPGARLAAVAVASGHSGGDVVVAARSLREVERREDTLQWEVGAGWVVTLALSLAVVWLIRPPKA